MTHAITSLQIEIRPQEVE